MSEVLGKPNSFNGAVKIEEQDFTVNNYSAVFDILSNASSVPSEMCFFTILVNIPKKPANLISHSTSILVLLFPTSFIIMFFVPFIGPSIILILIDFFGSIVTISLHIEFLKLITTSLSMIFPIFFVFLIDLVPCQNSGSLSTSATSSQTLSNGAANSLLT